MPTANEYRRQAETCLSLATTTTDPVLLNKLREMACDFMEKAAHADDRSTHEEQETIAELPAFVTNRPEQPFLPPGAPQPKDSKRR